MKPKTMASYLPALTKIIEATDQTGTKMNLILRSYVKQLTRVK